MRIPISIKIIILTGLIIIISLFFVAQQSSQYLKNVMKQREEFSNISEASLRLNQIETTLDNSIDKVKNISLRLISEINTSETSIVLENFKLPQDRNLVALEIWKVEAGSPVLITRKVQDKFVEKNKLNKNFLDNLRDKTPFPVGSILMKNIELQLTELNSSNRLISIGFPLAQDENEKVTTFAVAEFDSYLLQSLFLNESDRLLYLVDRKGVLLAHNDESQIVSQKNMKEDELVSRALESQTSQQQLTYKEKKDRKTFIGAYVKSNTWKLTLFSKIALDVVVEPADQVRRKAIYISGIVLSISLFFIFLFSLTLTSPIEKLAFLIQEIPKGNFNISARKLIKTKDEVGDLAIAFDQMTEGLKERDKVKNLFNKFHGSSITDNLLNQEISVGGTRKDVTVFFSDIRDFTKFSENHSPEEVVVMLNEYFEIMVRIINQHGGVVDKFIGDAIMAVWGVPKEDPNATINALKACVEMRKALMNLNESRKARGLSEIKIGMGLHAGDAISGTIGSEERMEYTVIGDTVNVTSRIESCTKNFQVDLLISDEVQHRLSQLSLEEPFKFELAGDIEVKGKSKPLVLFKVA